MLSFSNNSSKNGLYAGILFLIIAAAAFFLLSQYVFTDAGAEAEAAGGRVSHNSAEVVTKKLEVGFFSDPRYSALRDLSIQPKRLSDISVGKANPFEAEAQPPSIVQPEIQAEIVSDEAGLAEDPYYPEDMDYLDEAGWDYQPVQ